MKRKSSAGVVAQADEVYKRGFECWNAICHLQVAMVAANELAGHTTLFKKLGKIEREIQHMSSWKWE